MRPQRIELLPPPIVAFECQHQVRMVLADVREKQVRPAVRSQYVGYEDAYPVGAISRRNHANLRLVEPGVGQYPPSLVQETRRLCGEQEEGDRLPRIQEHQAGRKAEDICRDMGITTASFYKWRQRYGGMEASEVKKMKELQQRWFNQGIKKPLLIRMGINTGFCTVDSFGTSHYMDYTVLGTHVNLASRLESAADPGEILISHDSWALVKDVVLCRDKGEISVKGFSQPVRVHQVIDFRKDLGKDQSWFEDNTDGFSMHLDLEKIRNYDKERILEMLQKASERLREKIIN